MWIKVKLQYNGSFVFSEWSVLGYFWGIGFHASKTFGQIECSEDKGCELLSSHQRCSIKKVFLTISQNLQESTCARAPF